MERTPEVQEIDYENLPHPPTLDEGLIGQMDISMKSGVWAEVYNVVTMLRSINKHYPQFTPNVLGKYSPDLLHQLSKGRPMTVKNVERLIKEVFLNGKQINVEPIVESFLPIFLKKAANDIGSNKGLAQEVLTAFCQNCGYDTSFALTAQSCVDKNSHIGELAIKLLSKLLESVSNSITQLGPNTLRTIMIALAYLIDGKRANMKVSALDICLFVYKQIGSQNFLNLMNYSLSQQKIQSMGKAMQTHRCQKEKPASFADKLKQRKTMLMGRQQNNFQDQNVNTNMNGNGNFNMGNCMNNGNGSQPNQNGFY